jgi:hypothetical protein
MIGKLYHIEAMARKKALPEGLTEIERIFQWRQGKGRPILDALHAWLVKNQKRGHAAIVDRQGDRLRARPMDLRLPLYR